MAATLYVAIRGNYTEFQRDMTRVRGIAKESCRELSNQFNNAIDPKFFTRGLNALARGLKDINRIASTKGGFLSPAIADLKDLAAKAEVSSQTMQHLANRMAEVGRSEQLSKALKNIQKYAGLTDAELAKLQKKMGDTAGSMETAMNALGVRSTQRIKRDIAALEAAFDHLAKHGKLSAEELERAFAGLEKKLEPLYAELGVLNKPAGRSKSLEALGMKSDAEYRAEAKKIAQAYLDIKTSASSTAGDVVRAHARMIESYRRLREEMTAGQAKPQKPLYETDPGKVLGVRSNAQIAEEIYALQRAFMNFASAPGRAAEEVERARARMQASLKELWHEMGVLSASEKRDGFLKLLGIRSIEDIERDKQALIKAHRDLVAEFQSGAGRVTEQDLRNSLAARNAGLQRLAQEAGTWQAGARAEVNPLRQRYDTLVAQAGRGRTSFAQFETRTTARNAVNAFQELNGRLPRAREIREIAAATGVAANQIRKLRDELDHSSNAFKALIGYAQVWLTFGFAHTAVDFVKTAMALENVKVAFQAIYGTADMAQAKLDYVRQVSEQLGLSFLDTAEGAKKLFAAAAGTPVEKEANMVFKAFSDMSAAMKLSGDETKGVFLAISQMISKGKVSAEELRQQLAERMPGAVNLFARSIGKTTQELDKMLQKGEVTLEHFLMFSREVQNTYGPGAIAAGGSLQAEMNRLQNAWVDFKTSMTDTDTLASGVRSLTSMFKALSPVIEFISKHIHTLVTVSLAAWIGSSLAPGGKLSGVLNSIGAAAGKARERVEAFNKGQQAMVIRATGATAAVGKLRAALSGLGSGALYGALFAIGAGLLEIAYNAAKASRGFQNVSKNMSEYVADMTKSQEAMEKSNFTPSMSRKLMLGDIEKERGEFSREYEKVDNSVYSYSTRAASGSYYGGAFMQSGKGGDAEAAHKKAKELWDEFNKAIDAGNIEAAREFQNKAVAVWKGGMEKTVESIGGSLGADINAEWGAMLQKMGTITASGEKYLQTFSSESTDAAKRLGFNSAQMREDLKKLKEAAEKTDLGKALSGIQNMDKIRQTIGDTSIAYTDNAKAIVDAGDKLQNYLNQIQTGANNFKKHQEDVNNQAEAYAMLARYGNVGADAYKELQAAQTGLAGEQKELSQQTDGLAQYITNCALAAGGSETAFRMMESLVKSMAPLFEQLGISIETVIGKMRDFQAQAAASVYETAALSGAFGVEMQVYNARAGAAVKSGNFKQFRANKIGAINHKAAHEGAQTKPEITPVIEESIKREWTARQELAKLAEAGRKGGKRGGGGKRVDNTQEKYHSAEEGWRKKIADMQGQKDVQTLAKDFADMDKQLKGSSVDMKALKKDYYEAFNTHSLHEFEKTMFQLVGNEKALADIDIEEKLKAQQAQFDGMNKAAQELGLSTVDYTAKMEAYRKALQNNANEQWLEKQIPVYQEIAIYEKDKTKVLELQNQLIDIQAEKMANTFPPEVVERWKEVQRLQNATDAFSGIKRGFNSIAKDSMNAAQFMENTMTQTYDILSEGFTNFVTKGKVDMQDLLNSWINMVNQMVMKAAMSKVFDLIGGLFSTGAGALSGAAGGIQMGSTTSSIGSSISAGAMAVSALGNVFTGLHGWANQIVTRPTLFSYGSQITKFAKGGIMGEAGPEAIMPLTRTASGHLGVRTDGAAAPQSMSVTLVISDQTEGGVKADATGGEIDGKQIAVIVKQVENAMVARSLNGKSQYTKYLDRTRGLSNAKQLY